MFDYPESRSERIHGPAGYATYESFRPWLRDEFTFRCVYCLKRETWGQVTGEFELDHFQPLSFLKTPSDRFAAQFGHRHKRCHPVDELATVTERAPALPKSLELAVTRGLVAADHSGRPM